MHANNVTKMRCGKHDDASVLHGSDRMGVSVASPKQRLGVGGVASSVVDAHGAARSVTANESRRHSDRKRALWRGEGYLTARVIWLAPA